MPWERAHACSSRFSHLPGKKHFIPWIPWKCILTKSSSLFSALFVLLSSVERGLPSALLLSFFAWFIFGAIILISALFRENLQARKKKERKRTSSPPPSSRVWLALLMKQFVQIGGSLRQQQQQQPQRRNNKRRKENLYPNYVEKQKIVIY